MDKKIFTVTEANSALPKLSELLTALQQRFGWVRAHRDRVPQTGGRYPLVNEGPVDPEYFHCLMAIRSLLDDVEQMGAQVKDVSTGLVDFPARMQGRSVLLCWRLGEDEVGFWHDLESGFSGRQPLPDSERRPPEEEEGN